MKAPHLSEYLSESVLKGIYKSASTEPPPPEPKEHKTDWKRVAGLAGAGALGSLVGGVTGFAGLELADRLMGGGGAASSKTGIPASVLNKIVPIAGAGAGLTYTLWKLREMEKMRRALQPSSDDNTVA